MSREDYRLTPISWMIIPCPDLNIHHPGFKSIDNSYCSPPRCGRVGLKKTRSFLLYYECQTPPWVFAERRPGSPMSPLRGPMGGGAFIIAWRGTVYVTLGPYLPIAKSRSEGLGMSVKTPLGYCIPPSGIC